MRLTEYNRIIRSTPDVITTDWMGEMLCAADAKQLYFLSSADLREMVYEKPGCWGAGNCKLYARCDLEAVAQAKHGAAVLAKKRTAQDIRMLAKFEAERSDASAIAYAALHTAENAKAADDFERELLAYVEGDAEPDDIESSTEVDSKSVVSDCSSDAVSSGGHASAAPPAAKRPKQVTTPALSERELAAVDRLIDRATRALEKTCTWEYLRTKNAEYGTAATVLIERVHHRLFAGMIGRPTDPNLRTVAKTGAWHKVWMSTHDLVGYDRPITGRGGKFNSNEHVAIDDEEIMCVKYCAASRTVSITAQVIPGA